MGYRWKIALFLYLTLWFLTGFAGLFWLLNGGLRAGSSPDWSGISEYLHYACAGLIGGSLYGLRMFHKHFDSLTPRFLFWYAMRPYLTAGMAVMTVILFDSGILILQISDSLSAKIGLSFLAGFGYGKFMEKITLLTEALFNGNEKAHPSDSSDNGNKLSD